MRVSGTKRFIQGLLVLFLVLIFPPCRTGAAPVIEKRLLLIFSYNMAYAQHYKLAMSFFEELNRKKIPYRLTQLELDALNKKQGTQKDLDLYLSDIRRNKYDVILLFGEPAVRAVSACLDKIPSNVPIVFCGVEEIESSFLKRHPNTTGVLEEQNAKETLELGLKLFPEIRKILILANWTRSGIRTWEQIYEFKKNHPNLEIIFLRNDTTSTEEMLQTVRFLKPETMILFQGWFNRNRVNFVSLQYIMSQLESISGVPVMVMNDAMLRYGVVGGLMSPSSFSGQYLADSISLILRGWSADALSITKIPAQKILNSRQLEFQKVSSGLIPADALLENGGLPFRLEKRELMILASLVLLVIACLLIIIILTYIQYSKLKDKHEAILTNLPFRLGIVSASEHILYYHQEYSERGDTSAIRHLRNFPFPVYEFLRKNIRCVFENDFPKIADYKWEGRRRRVEFYPLRRNIFSQKAVMWVSNDIEHLTNTMEEFKQLYHQTSLVLNTIRDAVLLIDENGLIKRVNPAASRLINCQEKELIGKKLNETFILFNKDKQLPLQFPLDEVFRTGSYIYEGGNILLRTATSKEDVYVTFSIAPVSDIAAGEKSAVIVIQDVSESKKQLRTFQEARQDFDLSQKTIAEKLLCSENEKQRILETIPVPVLLFDKNLKLKLMNRIASKLFARHADSFISDNCSSRICGLENQETCPVHLAERDFQPHSCEISIDSREYVVQADPIINNGELYSVLVVYQDLTELNYLRKNLFEAQKKTLQANKAKNYFLASMSHELRTPLNSVLGFCELLLKEPFPQEVRNEYLRSIQSSGNILLNLLNDILDLSRLEADQITLIPENTDAGKLLREISEIFRLDIVKRGLKFNLNIPDNLPLFYLDSHRLRQILLNLIGNAVKFTERGSVTVDVSVKQLGNRKALLKFAVTDTGSGIPEDKLASIFEPYTRKEPDMDTVASGLGLAIASRMTKRMGGVIAAQSTVGEGSSFTLILKEIPVVSDDSEETASSLRKLLKEPEGSEGHDSE